MGQILRAKCIQCDFETELFVGGGRMDCDRDAIVLSLPEKQRYLMEAGAVRRAERLSVERLPVRCTSCGAFYAQAVVSYAYHDSVGTLRGQCPNCGAASGAVDLTGKSVAERSCPRCGGDVSLARIGHWD